MKRIIQLITTFCLCIACFSGNAQFANLGLFASSEQEEPVYNDADAADYITRLQIAGEYSVPEVQRQKIHKFCVLTKQYGIWDSLAGVNFLHGSSLETHSVMLKGAAPIFVGSPVHDNMGVDFDAALASQYIRTGWIPSANTTASRGGHISYYSMESIVSSAGTAMGASSSGGSNFELRLNNNVTYAYGFSSSTPASASTPSSIGGTKAYFINTNTEGTLYLYREGAAMASVAAAATAPPTVELYVGALNASGTASRFETRRCGGYTYGYGLAPHKAQLLTSLFVDVMKSQGR